MVVIDKQGDIRSYKVGYDPGGDEELRASVAEAGNPKLLAGVHNVKGAEPAPTVPDPKERSSTEEAGKAKTSGTHPQTAEEAYRRGMQAFRTRHSDEALALLGKAIAMKPSWALPHVGRARVEYQEKRYTEAIHDFDEGIRLDPKCAQCYDTRGLAYSYSGQHARAIEDYTRAIALNPQSPAPYNNRGWAYSALGKHEKALEDLETAIRIAPDYVKAYENRGLAYSKLQNWPQAIADYTAAMEANPSRWQYERRAEAKRSAGDVQGAEEDRQKAAELPVNSGEPPSQ